MIGMRASIRFHAADEIFCAIKTVDVEFTCAIAGEARFQEHVHFKEAFARRATPIPGAASARLPSARFLRRDTP